MNNYILTEVGVFFRPVAATNGDEANNKYIA